MENAHIVLHSVKKSSLGLQHIEIHKTESKRQNYRNYKETTQKHYCWQCEEQHVRNRSSFQRRYLFHSQLQTGES